MEQNIPNKIRIEDEPKTNQETIVTDIIKKKRENKKQDQFDQRNTKAL